MLWGIEGEAVCVSSGAISVCSQAMKRFQTHHLLMMDMLMVQVLCTCCRRLSNAEKGCPLQLDITASSCTGTHLRAQAIACAPPAQGCTATARAAYSELPSLPAMPAMHQDNSSYSSVASLGSLSSQPRSHCFDHSPCGLSCGSPVLPAAVMHASDSHSTASMLSISGSALWTATSPSADGTSATTPQTPATPVLLEMSTAGRNSRHRKISSSRVLTKNAMLARIAAGFSDLSRRAQSNVEEDFEQFQVCSHHQLGLASLAAPKVRNSFLSYRLILGPIIEHAMQLLFVNCISIATAASRVAQAFSQSMRLGQ